MTTSEFTLQALRTTLLEGAGTDENVDLNGDIADTTFEDLGYESLAMLETVGRIEREYGIDLDEEEVALANTPRALIRLVNDRLSAAQSA
ncbi:actinorhodin polyketide synthase [Streptomyces sp. WZ.A104]|uniref:Acyl carrier protein n=1 Tax=Streptomyces durocortorensis TaxID=2811104 RepID=A0ABY9W628_9ACTN|nr:MULTISPECIES: acyl carrier protein [Streptomyces]PCG87285.1 actinorhodin polyketide synthase [Streptomyces sp. WZ.A104]WNF30944.1 acyl carrier protein [Streptomyces durocortorensis]